MRDRLVELISEIVHPYFAEGIADKLIENGVIVLPCKVGKNVYHVCKRQYAVDGNRKLWVEDWVIVIHAFDYSMIPEIGKTVFLTREEAEQALKGGKTL